MIERKRRNDFVRKREFDMLRRVRREGLSPEQLAALGTSSRIDDSEVRLPRQPPAHRRRQGQDRRDRAADGRRGQRLPPRPRRPRAAGSTSTPAAAASTLEPGALSRPESRRRAAGVPTGIGSACRCGDDERLPALPPLPDLDDATRRRAALHAPARPATPAIMATGLPPLAPLTLPPPTGGLGDFGSPFASRSARSCTTRSSTRP
jgi:hypothetical protein